MSAEHVANQDSRAPRAQFPRRRAGVAAVELRRRQLRLRRAAARRADDHHQRSAKRAGGKAYSAMLAASGGTAPMTWTLTSGTLPAGLALNAQTGAITGTPTATVAAAA